MNVGIVGCGRITALRHLPALARVDGVRVTALADVDAPRLDAVARECGGAKRYADYEELIADGTVDAVAVCVPPSLHADVACAALEAGKHVLIEKPMTLDLDDAERVREAATRSSGAVVIGLNLRRHRLLRRAREVVLGGGLGEVEAVRTVFTSSYDYRDAAQPWRLRRATGGGALVEMGPHHLDLWPFLTGRQVAEVFASSRSGRDEDDTVVVAGVLDGGARAETLLSQRSTNVNEVDVFGELGRLRVSLYRYDGLEVQLGRSFGGDLRQRARALARAATEVPGLVRGARGRGDHVEAYTDEWRHFVDVVHGRATADPGLEDGIHNVSVLAAAIESLESGRPVRVAGSAVAVAR